MIDRVGHQFGNYRLTHLLGQGGFADVYLGEHIYLGTQAAIKVLHTRLLEEDIEHFRTEARTIARLIYPHIVRILDFGVEGITPFLVMDYAQGGTLRKRHPRGSCLELSTLRSYVSQIAAALEAAHQSKIIHRDIKPENILLGEKGELLLSDFGIATIAQSSRYQNTQNIAGTIGYMAPEQIQGKPRLASDQYSLGIVIYEWLCGTRPFRGSFTELCTQHMFASPPPLLAQVPTLPESVQQVVFTALAKDPKDRFNSILAFATAFAHACEEPIIAPIPAGPTHPSFSPLSSGLPAERVSERSVAQAQLDKPALAPPLPSTKAQQAASETPPLTELATGSDRFVSPTE